MRSPDPTATPRRGRRVVVTVVLLAAVLLPYGLTFSRLWGTLGDTAAFSSSERDGVGYLRPLVRLLAATADAQSAAVAGSPVDADGLVSAAAAVGDLDGRLGSRLSTSRRWADLSTRLSALRSTAPTGQAAYLAYSQVVDLELALVSAVGDSSNLILDPALDAYYVMDTTLLRIPAGLVDSGRVVDLARLAGPSAVAVATLRSRVGSTAAAVDSGLQKSFASTRSQTLGPAMLPALDRIRDAFTGMAPPVGDLGLTAPQRTLAQDVDARRQVRDAALALETVGLDQLDLLLRARVQAADADRRLVAGVTLAALAIALGVWWLVGARRRPSRDDDLDDHLDDDQPPADAVPPELVEARELLEARRLVRVGRAVTAQRER